MGKIRATVLRGKMQGTELTPHRFPDGAFRVSLASNLSADAVRVEKEEDLPGWLERGYGLRMSGPSVAPSIYTLKSVRIDPD